MSSRLSLAIFAAGFIAVFAFVHAQDTKKDPPKEVIPHAQSKPPGPPKTPAEAIKAMTVPPGFSVELVASEPEIVNPVAMHIDEKGRFWITESYEYPRRSPGPGKDVVKVLELGDDGKAKKITTVIEGLNIPSGINVGHGGVWVANAPDILYYPIEDFDKLKLGRPQVVVTGFGRDDTHELPNSLTWGPDGWLYGLNGVFNRSVVKQNGKTFDFTCALFRIHPRTKEFQLFCEGTSNPWGVAFNDRGDAFISACVIDHLWHLTQTGYYHRQGGPYPPFTWKIESIVKHKHQKAAYCGIVWYDADAYPEEYRKKLYMGNIHGNCINSDELVRDGSTYQGKLKPDFLSANDAWFMPVVQKVGPDGSMYILDWYDRYHCYQDANRDPKGIDRLYGRLYRVRYKDTPRATNFDLTKKSNAELIELLDSPNVFTRDHAQRRLTEVQMDLRAQLLHDLEKGGKNPERFVTGSGHRYAVNGAALEELALSEKQPMTRRLAAVQILAATDMTAAKHKELLASKDATLRAWGARILPSVPDNAAMVHDLAKDSSPEVQIQAAIAARRLPGIDPIPVLIEVLNNCGNDKLIPHIVWQNLHPLLETRGDEFLQRVEKLDPEKSANVLNLMPRVVDRMLAVKKQDPQALVSLVGVLSKSPSSREACAKVLGMLGAKVQSGELSGENLKSLESRLLPVVKKLQNASNLTLAQEATLLGASLKDEESVQEAQKILGTPALPESLRLKALASLAASGDGVLTSVDLLLKNPKNSTPVFRGNVLQALGKLDSPKVGTLVLERYADLEPEVKPRAIELLTERPVWGKQLLGEIQAKKIPTSAVNLNQVRKLLATKDAGIAKQVEAIWGTIREGRNPDREKVVAQMRDIITKTPGDPNKGTMIFKKLCAQCHKLHGDGAEVGPDITGNGRSDFEQLLSNVFDPSLVIGAGYKGTIVVTKRGQSLNGLLVEDSPQRVVLKTQGGKVETIARADIDEVTTSKLSYMPEDVERQLSPQEIADLFALLVLDRPPSDPTARKIPGTPR